MNSPVTMSMAAVVMIFLAGMIVGWFLATIRKKAVINMSGPANPVKQEKEQELLSTLAAGASKLYGIKTTTKTFRALNLKCECGNVAKFSDHPGLPPGTEPFPSGDTYTCPKCGKTQNLADLQHLIEEAMAK